MIQTAKNTELEQLLAPGILHAKTILVAEDDETNYFLIHEYLEFSQATLIWARSGREAVAYINEAVHIDLVLMDIQMPDLNGFEALEIIKRTQAQIPIIAITAYAVSGDRERGMRAGFIEYLSKPLSRKILMEHIMRFI